MNFNHQVALSLMILQVKNKAAGYFLFGFHKGRMCF